MNEFDIIESFFSPLTMGRGDLANDAAVLEVPEGHELVITTDTLNAGTHFLENAKPADIAHKALRVNLSDLAAMGAQPFAYQLALALPEKPSSEWLEDFTGALLADQKEFGIYCSGGDTTGIKGPLSISITAMGLVPSGKAVTRSGARDGDDIILTGPLGDAALFLKHQDNPALERLYYRPQPRIDLNEALHVHARAAVDISDGLVADLGHICAASNLAAEIHLDSLPVSEVVQNLISARQVSLEDLITGGDDYQLALAIAPEHTQDFIQSVPGSAKIGRFYAGNPEVKVLDASGETVSLKHTGWSHF